MMKIPLKTHFYQNVCDGLQATKTGLLAVLFLFLVFNLSYSQSSSNIECQCLNNGTDFEATQFGETVTINSNSGESWVVVSSADLYSSTSPAPPADPILLAPGTMIPEGLPGQYILDAIRLNNTDWTLVVSNGTIELPIASMFTCEQASSEIIGDFGSCIGTVETYEVESPDSRIESIVWSLSGGGNIVGGQGTRKIFVDWGDTVGDYDVSFSGSAYSYDGQSNDACTFSNTETVAIMDEEAFSMACNNQVNISLNGNCELNFVADMVLEDMKFSNDSYDLEFTDIETGEPVIGPTLGMEFVGKTLQVKVIHECSGNSCWGILLLEDKSIPQLECEDDVVIDCDELMAPSNTGFPVPDDVTITDLGDDKYLLEGFDLCSDVILTFEDVPQTTNLCEGPYSSIIDRGWIATDASGNKSTCVQTISINRASLDDITFPDNYDDVLGPNPSLVACANYPRLPNGNPDPSFTGMPEGVFCLNVTVSYEDVTIPKCGDQAFKIRRRWSVNDLCDDLPSREQTQYITVMDNVPPVVAAPQEFTVGTTLTSCSSIIEVPAPIIIFECSEYEYTVSYKIPDGSGNPLFQPTNDGVVQQADGTFLISGLDDLNGNMIWIVYYVTDACGNMTTAFTEVEIIDDIQPIPVCDLHTFIGLNENGIGYASIESFDDGSWDNCGEITREVRRMNNVGCGEASQWGKKVKFCCEDVGDIIMIQLRVTDKAGNSNICMVEAEVQDNHAPVITFCPIDITIDCDDDTDNLDQYGTATAEDNCNVVVTSTSTRNINSCGTGFITRTFRAEDAQGNFETCIQRIFVQSLDPFYINPNNPNDPNDDIIWPSGHTLLNGCASSGILPDDLPAGKQRPVILDEGCSRISFTYTDVIFQYTEEACAKILRTWKVIDDCVYVPFSNIGYWEYTQVIKVQNSTKPNFITGCTASDFTIVQQSNCTARIQATASAIDDCTAPSDLEYTYKIDEDNNGGIDFTGTGNMVNRVVSFGTHRVIWEVEDECGNVQTCAAILNVDDNKAPTPYCLSEVVTVVMETSGSVTIWANDFDNGSYDNCADQDELRISFSTNTFDTSMEFTCEDLEGVSTDFQLQIYVTDPSGNQDFCTTTLVVQDNQGHCPDNNNGGGGEEEGRVTLGGGIYNDINESVVGIEVSLMANLPEFPLVSTTDLEGEYTFSNLLANENYNIVPTLDENYNEGVSTLDLVLIQRHLLGLAELDNPYKVIAADINNSESITASDLLQLRKLILGIYSELPNNDSWRFVDAAIEFSDINDPFPFDGNVSMEAVAEDYMDANFVAVKIGDVNNSASYGFQNSEIASSRTSTSLIVEDQYLNIGRQDVTLALSDIADVYGMQLSIDYNENLVSDINLASDVLNVTEANYNKATNKLFASIHNATSETITDDIMTLIIDVKKAGYLSEMISLSDKGIRNEIYTAANANVKSTGLTLAIENRSTEANTFELLQNVPNPFTTTTDIGFVLPTKQEVSLTVYDVTGKTLIQKIGTYQKGYNTITLDVSEINASGVLYYQLDTEGHSAGKKMIIIK
ncbi:MAG: hypothetical protein ACJA1A_002583 [Saprospiraceae bacterium]|jgi:hypothetical protein